MSYQTSIEDAKHNAGRLLKEAHVDAVKLEGGAPMVETVSALVDIGIAVQGHLGLTPQSISAFGGFKTQARSLEAARQLISDARALEEAGAFSIVLEAIPAKLASLVSKMLTIPTIGIGAGVGCDGQVLVMHDIMGLFDQFTPRFVKKYANLREVMLMAMNQYHQDVKTRQFPSDEHEFKISADVWTLIEAEYGIDVHDDVS